MFQVEELSETAKSDLLVNAATHLEYASASAKNISRKQAEGIAETLEGFTRFNISVSNLIPAKKRLC